MIVRDQYDHYDHDDEPVQGMGIMGNKPYNRRIKHAPYLALSYVWGKGSLT